MLIISVYFYNDLEQLPSSEKKFPPMFIYNKPNSISSGKGCRKHGVKSWTGPVCSTVHAVCHITALLLKASNNCKRVQSDNNIIRLCHYVPMHRSVYSWAQRKAMDFESLPFYSPL